MTTDWDGQGLPPAALARMERGRTSPVHSSLLPVPGHVGVESCGFSVVGEVMGCIVETIGFTGWAGCGYGGFGGYVGGPFGGFAGSGGLASTVTSGQGGWVGYAPYVDALYHGFDTALYRMLLECQSLGGDGVVGVRLDQRHLGQGNREFVALGTAVRAARRPAACSPVLHDARRPGRREADGTAAGCRPPVVVAISVAIRHDDWATASHATRTYAGNVEVLGLHRAREPRPRRRPHRSSHAQGRRSIGADGACSPPRCGCRSTPSRWRGSHRPRRRASDGRDGARRTSGTSGGAPPRARMVLPLD